MIRMPPITRTNRSRMSVAKLSGLAVNAIRKFATGLLT